MTERKE